MQPFATVIAAGIAVAALPGLAQAQRTFPTKPIRLLVGYAPGGWPDAPARKIGHKISESWGRPVVVDNRPGGGGTLAAVQVAKETADGGAGFRAPQRVDATRERAVARRI